ncbi:xaa-Arg dipeptidase-like [Dermacentor variabilis]|uniref:xaa-Arg dipeptidase-like n=1 Tax=Dermacentor variabilis TaxID=34621 RepID=UPI003F5B22F3
MEEVFGHLRDSAKLRDNRVRLRPSVPYLRTAGAVFRPSGSSCPGMAFCYDSRPLSLHFKGKIAHAGAWPWEGLSALDAAVASYVNVSLLRLQLKPTTRIHGVITEGGKCPNVIPEETEMCFTVRAPSAEDQLLPKVEACFRAAADATGCSLDMEKKLPYMNFMHNPPTLRVAKVLALTALDLLTDAELLREAKREFAALQLPSEEELQSALS